MAKLHYAMFQSLDAWNFVLITPVSSTGSHNLLYSNTSGGSFMQVKSFRIPVAAAALLSCTTFGWANADETVTTTTTSVESPSIVTTTAPATVTYFRTASPMLLVTTLEGRRKDLDKSIDEARDRGEISSQKAEAMKRELKRIAKETGTGTISYSRAVMLAEDLDLIGTQYRTIVTTAPAYVPIISGSHFVVYNGQILELDDLSVRRVDLEARVTKDLLQGRLTDAQAANLRDQLDNIGNEAAFYRADGNLDFKEAKRLYRDFDHVATQIENMAGKENN